jgi:hypothetical protein
VVEHICILCEALLASSFSNCGVCNFNSKFCVVAQGMFYRVLNALGHKFFLWPGGSSRVCHICTCHVYSYGGHLCHFTKLLISVNNSRCKVFLGRRE